MLSPEDSGSAGTTTATVKRRARKGTPPSPGETLGALAEGPHERDGKKSGKKAKAAKAISKRRTRSLNFRVSSKFRRAFKQAATAHDCKKVELLERIFLEWDARGQAAA
jgi:hypothetical protein